MNGIDITNECHKAGNNVWVTVDLGSKFKSLQSFRIANNSIYVGGFIIDGVVMKDSTRKSFGTNGFYFRWITKMILRKINLVMEMIDKNNFMEP